MEGKKLLLHACCGPCSIEPLRLLQEDGWDITIAYVNANIQPEDEYLKRMDTLRWYCERQGIEVIEGSYDVEKWNREVAVYGADRPQRCRACYRMRLEECVSICQEQGYDALSSTLTVSPYQFTDTIKEELDRACEGTEVQSVFGDFREQYPEATRISRDLGMYRQNYCGCLISKAEAEAERAERKAQRQQEVAQRAAARAEKEAAEAASREAKKAERAAYDELQRRKRAARDAARAQRKAQEQAGE